MPRPDPTIDLTDAEKRDLVTLIQAGKPLPEKYRRTLEQASAPHVYPRPGRYPVAVKVIDIFGNDTMTLVPVNVG